jgi:biopolymer transport protein ExbD
MRRHVLPQVKEGGVNVTPLIDIVMCMIVFFMLVAKIGVATGAEEQIDIPVSTLGTDINDIGNTLVLNVREVGNLPMVTALVESDGSVSRTGRPVELKIYDPTTKRRPLVEVLRKLRHGDPRNNQPANPDFKVIIRGDRSISYRTLDPVLMACMDANVKNVNLNTAKP